MAMAFKELNQQPDCNIECSSETISQVVYLSVSEPVWKYVTRSKKYSNVLELILLEHKAVYEFDAHMLSIKCETEATAEHAKTEIIDLVDKCKLDISTFIIPHLEPDIYSEVVSFLEESEMPDELIYYISVSEKKIYLTGKTKLIEHCLGSLEETFGVTGALPFVIGEAKTEKTEISANSNTEEDHNYHQSLQTQNSVNEGLISVKPLHRASDDTRSQDEIDIELYGTENDTFVELENDALIVNKKIWSYIEKHSNYSESVSQIRERSDVNMVIDLSVGTEETDDRVRLVFTGSDKACIHMSMLEMKFVFEKCHSTDVKTLQVPCPESAVHQRIAKLLKSINRLPSYVSMEPEVITITGTKKEIEDCIQKLKNYGLQYDDPVAELVIDNPPDFTENERNPYEDFLPESKDEGDISGMHQQCEHYRQLPVPIEEDLWFYIDSRCKQQLHDLQKVYNIQIIADGEGTPGFVSVTVASHSLDMLDCGQDAIISLIVQLREQIVVGILNTNFLEDLPSELQGMLQQRFHDMESIVVLRGKKIITIGPNHEAMKSQQIVSAFMQSIISDARSKGIDTSMFDQAMKESTCQEGYANANMHEYHGFDSETRQPQVSNRDVGQQSYTMPKHYDSLQTLDGKHLDANHIELVDSKGDRQFRVTPETLCAVDPKTSRDKDGSARSSLKCNTAGEVNDHMSPQVVHSKSNGNHALSTDNDCNVVGVEDKIGVCSICQHDSKNGSSKGHPSCGHFYCLSCVCQYFGEYKCPVCSIEEQTRNQIISQPEDGTMLTTYDNSFKLPGFENNSRGTIIVTYAFSSGIQSAELPNPGQIYPALTTTAFFPMCLNGSKVVELLQRAFEKRLIFKISQNKNENCGNLVWNGIRHKVSIFGGPQQSGYPDPNYLQQIFNDLAAKGLKETE